MLRKLFGQNAPEDQEDSNDFAFALLMAFIVYLVYLWKQYQRRQLRQENGPRVWGVVTESGCKVRLPIEITPDDVDISVTMADDGFPEGYLAISPILSLNIPNLTRNFRGITIEMETWATTEHEGVDAHVFRRQTGGPWELISTVPLPHERKVVFTTSHLSDFAVAVRCTLAIWGVLDCYVDNYVYYDERGVFTNLSSVSCTKFAEEVRAMEKSDTHPIEITEPHNLKGKSHEELSHAFRAGKPDSLRLETPKETSRDVGGAYTLKAIMQRFQLKRSYAAVMAENYQGEALLFFSLELDGENLNSKPIKFPWPVKIQRKETSTTNVSIGHLATGRARLNLTQLGSPTLASVTTQEVDELDRRSVASQDAPFCNMSCVCIVLSYILIGLFLSLFLGRLVSIPI